MSTNNPNNIVAGQRLWCVTRNGNAEYVTVTKVARRWAEIGSKTSALDMMTMELWGIQGRCLGKCYLSQQAHEESVAKETAYREASRAWDEMRSVMPYSVPEHLTAAEIRGIMAKMKPPTEASR